MYVRTYPHWLYVRKVILNTARSPTTNCFLGFVADFDQSNLSNLTSELHFLLLCPRSSHLVMMEGSELDADQKKLLLKQQKQQKEEMWLKKLRAQKDKG